MGTGGGATASSGPRLAAEVEAARAAARRAPDRLSPDESPVDANVAPGRAEEANPDAPEARRANRRSAGFVPTRGGGARNIAPRDDAARALATRPRRAIGTTPPVIGADAARIREPRPRPFRTPARAFKLALRAATVVYVSHLVVLARSAQ